jgi:hypothetical protein
MKSLFYLVSVLALAILAKPSLAVEFRTQAGALAGQSNKLTCGLNAKCSVVGGVATVQGAGVQVLASTTALTKSQCGATVYNSGAVVQTLPLISTVGAGCRFTFLVTNASNFDVNPNDVDKIAVLTDATGDAIRSATLGNSVVLESTGVSIWMPVGKEQGTWSDIN